MPCTAANAAGFVAGSLRDNHVGVPFTKWDKPQLTKQSWTTMQATNSKYAEKGALFHPLTF